MEEHLDDNGVIQQTNYFQPREDPLDESSPFLSIDIDRITGIKIKRILIRLVDFLPFLQESQLPVCFLYIKSLLKRNLLF